MNSKFDECPICLEEKPLAFLKPCHHNFCPKCIHKILHNTVSCPMCREIFTDCSPPLVVFSSLDPRITMITMQRNELTKMYGIGIIQQGNQVIVSSVENYVKHVEKDQKIVGINNLPCYNKHCFVNILNENEKNVVYFLE